MLKTISAAVLVLAVTACGSTGYPKEKWTNFRSNTVQEQVAEGDTNLVFFRGETGDPKKAVNIYVNGEYHTSLQQDGYSQLEVCAQPQRIGAYVTGTDNRYEGKATGGQTYELPNGQVAYFRVVDDEAGQAVLQPVDAETAKSEIHGDKYQNNTLSRVDKESTCAPRELKKYVLNAAVLFPFNKSDSKSILSKGRNELAAIANDIRQHPGNIVRVEVIGHTDPDGKAEYNQKLSEKRAQSIAQLLAESGVARDKIQAIGRGESELLVSGCKQKNRAARQACNQPNRRVEIKLFGTRQQQQ
ncbi:outer membrane protein OmpA-like peptidoglycan-associated protein [Neisseria perflava]|uniref:OmpA family protein n=1 Tax=Neisseria perflava TaxID=33053 RepID=UPI0020A21E71|nr:OmpA family protein [Neisseria perflava]MCP1773044.1 outer membrane protein OmpA-like peptidoglycan-associated protein [Neisseria perflava]